MSPLLILVTEYQIRLDQMHEPIYNQYIRVTPSIYAYNKLYYPPA
jgi:hypothetical protein